MTLLNQPTTFSVLPVLLAPFSLSPPSLCLKSPCERPVISQQAYWSQKERKRRQITTTTSRPASERQGPPFPVPPPKNQLPLIWMDNWETWTACIMHACEPRVLCRIYLDGLSVNLPPLMRALTTTTLHHPIPSPSLVTSLNSLLSYRTCLSTPPNPLFSSFLSSIACPCIARNQTIDHQLPSSRVGTGWGCLHASKHAAPPPSLLLQSMLPGCLSEVTTCCMMACRVSSRYAPSVLPGGSK